MEKETLMQILTEYAKQIADEYKRQIIEADAVATGKLRDFSYRMIQEGNLHYCLYFDVPKEWAYVEDGRRPGKFPPLRAILDWIRIKPVIPRPDKRGRVPSTNTLAYLISRKIALKGIKPRPLLKNTIALSDDAIKGMMDAVYQHMEDEVKLWLAPIDTEVAKIKFKI